jgi:DNA primase
MPGIDFDKLRREIPMEDVLQLFGFEPSHRRGDQWSGRCPLHSSSPGPSRKFSVNVATRRYYCHKCRRGGNQIELWAAFTGLSLHPAAVDLCQALGRPVPWIYRW